MTGLTRSTRRDGVMQRGEWRDTSHPVRGDKSALVCCPKCGKIASLLDHDIDNSGLVTPSLVCPMDKCDFHDFVHLVGWRP